MKWQNISELEPTKDEILLWCSDLSHGQPVGAKMGYVVSYNKREFEPRGEGMMGNWTFTHFAKISPPTNNKDSENE